MAMTQNAWIKQTSDEGYNRWKCTIVTGGTDLNDVYTLKTPKELDGSKAWYLQVSSSATPDGSALPLDLWLGYNSDFAVSGDGATVTAGDNGAKFKQISDDVVLAVTTLKHSWLMDPNWPLADVDTVSAILDGYKIRTIDAPYYALNFNGASTLASVTITCTIAQRYADEGNLSLDAESIGGIGADPS